MNLLLIIFLSFTLPYALLWHNKSSGPERKDASREHAGDKGTGAENPRS